jgi:hypothetical protein
LTFSWSTFSLLTLFSNLQVTYILLKCQEKYINNWNISTDQHTQIYTQYSKSWIYSPFVNRLDTTDEWLLMLVYPINSCWDSRTFWCYHLYADRHAPANKSISISWPAKHPHHAPV